MFTAMPFPPEGLAVNPEGRDCASPWTGRRRRQAEFVLVVVSQSMQTVVCWALVPTMTPHLPDDEIRSTEEFETALGRVMLSTLDSDVDPRGSWVYRTDDSTPDVEVMVCELSDGENAG